MTTHTTKVLIIGAGPAGYTAAIYAARANLQPMLVQGLQPGGQLTITTEVENYPGFADPIQGPWLMEQMQKQAENVGTKMFFDIITDVDFSKRPFVCRADSGDTYVADSIIIATGAQARWLGLESEEKFKGFGVSACATCDGFFYRGKEVVVVGGGNTAVEEAIYLTHHASKVTVVHRRDSFRAERIMQDRLFSNPKINVVWDTEIDEILGDENPLGVTGVRLRNLKTGVTSEMATHGVFVAIGHAPATGFLRGSTYQEEALPAWDYETRNNVSLVDQFIRPDGYINVQPGTTRTIIPGVFAAGDVADSKYRQAVTAAGMGCMAALDVERFLGGLE